MKNKLLIVFTFLGIMGTIPAFSQVSYVPSSAYRLSAGVDAGLTMMHGDLPNKILSPTGKLTFIYRVKEFVNVGGEIMVGFLQSGIKGGAKVPDHDGNFFTRNISWGLYSKNFFQSINIHGRLFVGQFTEESTDGLSYYLNNVYLGLGVGYIRNSISDVIRKFPQNNRDVPGIVETSSGVFVPIDLGINIPTNSNYSFNVNYKLSLSTSDGLDGYDMEGLSFSKDAFSFLSVGVRYNFGPLL